MRFFPHIQKCFLFNIELYTWCLIFFAHKTVTFLLTYLVLILCQGEKGDQGKRGPYGLIVSSKTFHIKDRNFSSFIFLDV